MAQVQHLAMNLDSVGDQILTQFVMDQKNIALQSTKEKILMHTKIAKLSNLKLLQR